MTSEELQAIYNVWSGDKAQWNNPFWFAARKDILQLLVHIDALQAKYNQLKEQLEIEAIVQGCHRDTIDALQAKLDAVPVEAIIAKAAKALDEWIATQVQHDHTT